MYSGVPTMMPAWVCGMFASASFAMPKSSTFTKGVPRPRRTRKMLSGLRSRWTIPLKCAAWSASHTCESTDTTAGAGSGVPTQADSGAPSRYSMMRYGRGGPAFRSKMLTMFSWPMTLTARASA